MIKNLLRKLKRKVVQSSILNYDISNYSRYYSDSANLFESKTSLEREIMVLSHTIEKGLSHNNIKPLFGYNNAVRLSSFLFKYIKVEGLDEYIVNLGVSILKKYNNVNKNLGIASDKMINIPKIDNEKTLNIGAYNITKEEYFSNIKNSFDVFSQSRHSIRLYDCKSDPIDINLLKKCISLSMSSPSACNRQAVRVKIVMEQEKINKICDIQGGSRGFGYNSGALLIITSDIRYYMSSERRLTMFDCGLLTMNLVYALYFEKLGSCILNGSLTKEQSKEISSVITIQPYEMISTIISVSNIPDNTSFKIAESSKKNIEDIVTVI